MDHRGNYIFIFKWKLFFTIMRNQRHLQWSPYLGYVTKITRRTKKGNVDALGLSVGIWSLEDELSILLTGL